MIIQKSVTNLICFSQYIPCFFIIAFGIDGRSNSFVVEKMIFYLFSLGVMILRAGLWQTTVQGVSSLYMWRTLYLMGRRTGITSASAATSATVALWTRNIMTRRGHCCVITATWHSIFLHAFTVTKKLREEVSIVLYLSMLVWYCLELYILRAELHEFWKSWCRCLIYIGPLELLVKLKVNRKAHISVIINSIEVQCFEC